jgi:hypothetical protein
VQISQKEWHTAWGPSYNFAYISFHIYANLPAEIEHVEICVSYEKVNHTAGTAIYGVPYPSQHLSIRPYPSEPYQYTSTPMHEPIDLISTHACMTMSWDDRSRNLTPLDGGRCIQYRHETSLVSTTVYKLDCRRHPTKIEIYKHVSPSAAPKPEQTFLFR